MFIITLERHLTSRISPVPYPHCTRAYREDVLSKYHTRTARRLSVLWSVLSSIITENGPLLQRVITGLVASTAKHLFTIIVIFVRRHLKDFAMPLSRNIHGGQAGEMVSDGRGQIMLSNETGEHYLRRGRRIRRLGLGLEKSSQRRVRSTARDGEPTSHSFRGFSTSDAYERRIHLKARRSHRMNIRRTKNDGRPTSTAWLLRWKHISSRLRNGPHTVYASLQAAQQSL